MSSYKYDSIVSRQEADALKEMIFKRARERAEALNSDTQTSYTDNVQRDVMDLARATFVSEKNPFSEIVKEPDSKKEEQKIGFPKRSTENIKSQINLGNKTIGAEVAGHQIELTMSEARNDFVNKTSFMGALKFLNTQASITLVTKKGAEFEAIA